LRNVECGGPRGLQPPEFVNQVWRAITHAIRDANGLRNALSPRGNQPGGPLRWPHVGPRWIGARVGRAVRFNGSIAPWANVARRACPVRARSKAGGRKVPYCCGLSRTVATVSIVTHARGRAGARTHAK
jgi:hypothetical protein